MAETFTVQSQGPHFAVCAKDAPLQTPDKHPLLLPTKSLADAVCAEWQAHGKYSPSKLPLTSLAYTAIDQIGRQKALIVEALMAYIDTDTLSYRATGSETLARQQHDQWNPILEWAQETFGATWGVTAGVMPLDQPPELHKAVQEYLSGLDDMRLAAACVLSSGYSSLALAMAVLEKHVSAEEAFRLSRLEEESQAEAWGRDLEADQRAGRLKAEIMASAHFLDLLHS